jgi:hypothetical protein
MKNGNAWKMMQHLGHTFLKKLTFVIKLIEASLIHTKLRLFSIFSTGCIFNKSLGPFSISFWLDKLQLVIFSIRFSTIKPLV